MAKELKKVKVGLSSFESLRVPAIRNAFFRSLNDIAHPKYSQDTTIKKVTFNTTEMELVIRKIVGKSQGKELAKDQGKKPAKYQGKEHTKDKGKYKKDKNQVSQVDTPVSMFQGK